MTHEIFVSVMWALTLIMLTLSFIFGPLMGQWNHALYLLGATIIARLSTMGGF